MRWKQQESQPLRKGSRRSRSEQVNIFTVIHPLFLLKVTISKYGIFYTCYADPFGVWRYPHDMIAFILRCSVRRRHYSVDGFYTLAISFPKCEAYTWFCYINPQFPSILHILVVSFHYLLCELCEGSPFVYLLPKIRLGEDG